MRSSLPFKIRSCHCERKKEQGHFILPLRKVSLFAVLRRASFTVEAAWTIPLFFLASLALICMMEVYALAAEKTVRLQEQAETAALAASLAGDYAPSVIDLRDTFSYRPRFYPEALPAVSIAVRGRARPWTGRDAAEAEPAAGEEEELVYLSERATVYHTNAACSHLQKTILAVAGASIASQHTHSGGKYHACEKCVGSGTANGTVYITPGGDRFHNNAACSSLTRSVRLVKRSEAEDLCQCSLCLQMEEAG